jgi:hypothetical protein
MDNKALQAFFNGAFDLLKASFAASKLLSNATKGASREHAARELLRSLIPPVARVECGDVVDAHAHQTGQLDAVVVDHRAPTLQLGTSEASLVLAEGVLAILEIKSDLTKQAAEVVRTFRRVEPLRPSLKPMPHSFERYKEENPRFYRKQVWRREGQLSIPFIVVAGKGWKAPSRLERLAEELRDVVPKKRNLSLLLVTLDPPALAVCQGWSLSSTAIAEEERGDVVAGVWYTLVKGARLHSAEGTLRRLPLEQYFLGVPSTGTKEQPKAEAPTA